MDPSLDDPFEYVICNLCGEKNYKIKYKYDYSFLPDGFYNLSAKAGFHKKWYIVQCKNCGLIYTNPRYKKEVLDQVYEIGGGNWQGISYVLGRRKYISVKESFHKLRKDQELIIQLISRLKKKPGRVLEVGPGYGHILNALRALGWETAGIDLSPDRVRFMRDELNLNVDYGHFEDADLEEGYYDVVIAQHVFEHLTDPMGFLEKCKQILVPGGLIIMEHITVGSLGERIFRKQWRHYSPTTHLYYISMDTMRKYFEAAGLRLKAAIPFSEFSMKTFVKQMLSNLLVFTLVMIYGKPAFAKLRALFERLGLPKRDDFANRVYRYNPFIFPDVGDFYVFIARKPKNV